MKKRLIRQAVQPVSPLFELLTALSGLLLLCLSYASLNPVLANDVKSYTLDEAVATALEKNRLKVISQKSVAIAEAQYQQARSTYWPTLSLNANFIRRDETAIFEFPAQRFDVAPGMLPPVEVPALDVDLLGRDTSHYSLEMTYPLYTGGKRSSLIEQARLGVDIATKEVHRTNLQIVQDVKRYYYAALYTRQLAALAEDITISFEVLRDITQAFYDGASESVNKLDLLQSKLAHTLAEATYEELAAKHQAALAALSFTMGLEWQEQIQLGTQEYPDAANSLELDRLIGQAEKFNPQIEQLALAVEAYEAKVDEARSDHYPTIGLMASVVEFDNDLDGGLSVEENEHSWQLAIGMELKLFDGGLIKHRVAAAKAEKAQKEQQRLLLSESTATQIKHLFIQTGAARKQVDITQQAVETSQQNLDLSNRAYQTGAVKTEKIIEANLLDAMVRANLARASHDQALHLAEIAYLLGSEVIE
ncbi:MAG: TolC family protein [Candidatus Thiodiazotropha sp.]